MCLCVCVCVCVLQGYYHLLQRPNQKESLAMSTSKHKSIGLPSFFVAVEASQSDTVFLDWHVEEATSDVATSDDANDWPWGNDLLRQGERKKGARRETVLCKYQAMATL